MPAEILATAAGVATSANVVVLAGDSLAVGLKGISGDRPALVNIELFDGASYVRVGQLSSDNAAQVITAGGTYRFIRATGTCGVFSG